MFPYPQIYKQNMLINSDINKQFMAVKDCTLKVEPQSIPESFLKLKYLKTELEIFRKVQGPTSTGNLHDDYSKYIC